MDWLTNRKALLIVLVVFVLGAFYRAYHFAVTGFFVPDEYGYTYFHLGEINYQGRQFFQLFNSVILPHNVDQLVLIMPFYFMFWFSIGIFSAYKTMKLFGYQERAISATLLLSITIPVYLLFSAAILTEPVAFALAMLGMYSFAKFWKTGGYRYPFISAIFFVAAAYTRVDFIVFQALGFLPFAVAEFGRSKHWPKTLGATSAFAVPATFFAFYPSNGVVATSAALQSIAAATHGLPATINSSAIGTIVQAPPSGNLLYNALHFIAVGLVLGFNPVTGFLFAASFFITLFAVLKRKKDSLIPFLVGILGLGTFAGTVLVYMVVPNIPTSTALRYAYDASPAFFIFMPILFSKIKWDLAYTSIATSIIIVSLVGASAYPAFLQSNLTFSYPFLHGENFLSLDYRTPYAQIRDYFHSLPPQHFDVVAETVSLAGNVTTNWKFTPGVSDIAITFHPWNATTKLTHFYLYLEPDWQSLPDNDTIRAVFHFHHFATIPIYSSSSFFFAEVFNG